MRARFGRRIRDHPAGLILAASGVIALIGCGGDRAGEAQSKADTRGSSTSPHVGPLSPEATALAFVKRELGWERVRLLDSSVGDTPDAESRGPIELRVIKCAARDWDKTYPSVTCDSQRPHRIYPAALVTVKRRPGTDWEATTLRLTTVEQRPPVSRRVVRRFVTRFLNSRVRGSGAERFLAADAAGALPHPLYSAEYEQFRVLFIDGPYWPSASWETGVRLAGASRSFTETLFVGPLKNSARNARRLYVHGGRSGSTGP